MGSAKRAASYLAPLLQFCTPSFPLLIIKIQYVTAFLADILHIVFHACVCLQGGNGTQSSLAPHNVLDGHSDTRLLKPSRDGQFMPLCSSEERRGVGTQREPSRVVPVDRQCSFETCIDTESLCGKQST